MKTMKLVAKIQRLLKRPPEEMRLKKLRKTIKSLKDKQEELEDKLKRTRGKHAREKLKRKIDVLYAQRCKGAEVYRGLKKQTEAQQS
ncbi:hypothetical protein [Thiosocius teredinicola]|uniref:hypothetical protein n=1 Tax=Thiosocius teredinicola TaxID=1973002 RepID=UPI0009914CD8